MFPSRMRSHAKSLSRGNTSFGHLQLSPGGCLVTCPQTHRRPVSSMSPKRHRYYRPCPYRNQKYPGGFSILLHHKLNYLFRCDVRAGDGVQNWAHILPGPGWLHFITAKETQQGSDVMVLVGLVCDATIGGGAGGATFDFAKMPKVCAKMHKTFNQSGGGGWEVKVG